MNKVDMAFWTATFHSILYVFQILPEVLVCGMVLLSLLLSNSSVATVAAALGATQFLTGAVGSILMRVMPGIAKPTSSLDVCNQGHIGRAWTHLLNPAQNWIASTPTPYMTTLGFFGGWGWALQQLYAEEIRAGVAAPIVGTTVTFLLIMLLGFVFRWGSGCETLAGAAIGLAFGAAAGYMGAFSIGMTTERRATNIWGIPLLRDRIHGGAAVYVCPKS
jgi:hypothetical protein